jgi:hypothetical protein
VRDEAETSKRRVQPHSDLDPQQLPLMSLTTTKYKSFSIHIGGHQMVFKGCFQNTNEG